jgi:hypothetical protein
MDDPIKIVWRYKNNYRRIQYHTYIFIGDIDKTIKKLLDKIRDLNFYDALMTLSVNEYNQLEKRYGKFWYNKFFLTAHLAFVRSSIKSTSSYQKELVNKYGQKWHDEHIVAGLRKDRIIYSYNSFVKDELDRKLSKRKKKIAEEDDDVDYRTVKQNVTRSHKIDTEIELNGISTMSEDSDMYSTTSEDNNVLYGGDADSGDNMGDIDGDNDGDADGDADGDSTEAPNEVDAFIGDESDMVMDMEDIEDIYRDDDIAPDTNINQTTNLIKKALSDDNIFKKIIDNMVEFDKSKDDLIYDELMKNVYKKRYVTSQYIFKDDTIKTIKSKICTSIKNSQKYGKYKYITPSRQYLWSEYDFNNKIERVMIGQKWLRRNDILNIDIEPNPNLGVYEDLRGGLRSLKDNIKRYGSKIKWENDEFNILFDYAGYYTNNEIYMVDIYNEFGFKYNPNDEVLRNLVDVYVKIYFPKISTDDVKYIMEYINQQSMTEGNHSQLIYDTLSSDLIVENEIMNTVENVKLGTGYENIFKDNYITQSTIHVTLKTDDTRKMDLFRIFNEFLVSGKYPFIQYQLLDGQIIYKYHEDSIQEYQKKKRNIELLAKWFENSPYGISFKVRISKDTDENEKFMVIKLTDNGRIEYKTQWKEDDMATIDNIRDTYKYIRDLVLKINNEKNDVDFDLPEDTEFKFAFINTIQKFELPGKYIINHNDLSDFSRYFYPYVALVIEPRKRQSKFKTENESSKFGTYLRYKRVSKYENQARMEQRILYFMRNYEYNDKSLSSEIGKQFNITDDKAMEEIDRVRKKYPHIKKSRKILKKLENIPKYKPPGIGIDIQGKHRDNYKMRISGARNKEQLDRMITFMNVLIFLYIETYLEKIKDRQQLKEKLKKLTNIAKRRNRVNEYVDYENASNTVKQMAQLDKKRIGFKPEKGQSQWTRACQNSGDDKKRRPQQYIGSNIKELLKRGYKLNKKTNMYERLVKVNEKGKKLTVMIRAVKLPDIDGDSGDTGDIYYACSPNENGEHMFIGFLSKSNNPYGHCMPCCFKKDPLTSKNKEKKDYFMKCIGEVKTKEAQVDKVIGDKLYILQDTNKIQPGRFGFLPKYLDYFFNYQLGNTKKIKHHYLMTTNPGYYFKYGSRQDEYPFLSAICSALDINVEILRQKAINGLKADKQNQMFTYLNEGDIKTAFGTRNDFIEFIIKSGTLDMDIMYDLLTLPGILDKNGLNIFIMKKITDVVYDEYDREKVKEDFVLLCNNTDIREYMYDKTRNNIILLQEETNYYPISFVVKTNESSKDIDIISKYKYENSKNNIMHNVTNFFKESCDIENIEDINSKTTTITTRKLIQQLNDLNNEKYKPKAQIIDLRNKCNYVVTNNDLLIPTKPSGINYGYPITSNIDKYTKSMDETIVKMKELFIVSNKIIQTFPIGVYYDTKTKTDINVNALITKTYGVIPVIAELVSVNQIEGEGYTMDNEPLFEKVDREIIKGRSNVSLDERIVLANEDKYMAESYNLMRYEFSEYITNKENVHLRNKLLKIVKDRKTPKTTKIDTIRRILYKILDKDLFDIYDKMSTKIQTGGNSKQKFVHITDKTIDLTNYKIDNIRKSCSVHNSKDQCNVDMHCYWSHNNCFFRLTKRMTVIFINKISEELVAKGLKMAELMKLDDYFVSDIVDYNVFTQRPGQKIIKSTNTNINKLLSELFGKNSVPQIGKRRLFKSSDVDFRQLNVNNPMKDMGTYHVQNIIENNISIFRGFVNGYYWLKHQYYDPQTRNLGYYNDSQTDLATYFRSIVIDWLVDIDNYEEIRDNIMKHIGSSKKKNVLHDYVIKLGSDVVMMTQSIVELYVLSRVHKIPIIVFDNNNEMRYVFDDGLVYNSLTDGKTKKEEISKSYGSMEVRKKSINLLFNFITGNIIPDIIDVIYVK